MLTGRRWFIFCVDFFIKGDSLLSWWIVTFYSNSLVQNYVIPVSLAPRDTRSNGEAASTWTDGPSLRLRAASFATGSKLSFLVPLSIEEVTSFLGGCFQVKKLKGQLEERQKNGKLDTARPADDVLENGTDLLGMDLQSKRQALCGGELPGTSELPCTGAVREEENHHGTECPVSPQSPVALESRSTKVSLCGIEQDEQVGRARMCVSEPIKEDRCPKVSPKMPPYNALQESRSLCRAPLIVWENCQVFFCAKNTERGLRGCNRTSLSPSPLLCSQAPCSLPWVLPSLGAWRECPLLPQLRGAGGGPGQHLQIYQMIAKQGLGSLWFSHFKSPRA